MKNFLRILDRTLAEEQPEEILQNFLQDGDEDYVGFWQLTGAVCQQHGIDDRKLTPAETEKLWAGLQIA